VPNPAKKTDDADALTTPMGLYYLACSYHEAARVLTNVRLEGSHPGLPISFLYFHTIELFLKSFLRLHGHTVSELRSSRKFGHNFGAMRTRASELGLKFTAKDIRLIRHIRLTDAFMRSRYLQTGYYPETPIEALEQTAKSLRELVRFEFKKNGILARR
jgi:HEPN domain-containing protein